MQFNYNKIQTYTKNINNAIGPTISSTLRTVTSHSDTNCIYLAPNGLDTNAGTFAAPVLTLDKAITLLGGAKVIITIIRNGYVGDMIFSQPMEIIPSGTTIQTALGEIATIQGTSLNWSTYTQTTYIQGMAFGNGIWMRSYLTFIYKSTDGINWTLCYTAPSGSINGIAFGNGVFVATNNITKTTKVSTDGTSWSDGTAIADNFSYMGIAFGNGFFVAIAETIAYVRNVYKSADGLTWTKTFDDILFQAITYANDVFCVSWTDSIKLVCYTSIDGILWNKTETTQITQPGFFIAGQKGIWIAYDNITNSAPYYSYDLVNWNQSSMPAINTYIGDLNVLDGMFVWTTNEATSTYAIRVLTSIDGKSWNLIYSTVVGQDHKSKVAGGKLFISQYMTTYNNYYVTNSSMIDLANNTIKINGIILDGNNQIPNGIIGRNHTGFESVWTEFKNFTGFAISDLSSPTITKSIFHDDYNGLDIMTSPILANNLFYDIENLAINIYGSTLNVKNQTIVDSYQAIKINEAISTMTALKNLLIMGSGIDIESLVTSLTVSYSVLHGLLIGCIADTNCLQNTRSLFVDSVNYDFNLRHEEEDYPIPSPGVELGDDGKDAGCYDVTFTFVSETETEIVLPGILLDVKKGKINVNPTSAYTFSNGYKRKIQGSLWKLGVTLKDAMTNKMFYDLADLLDFDGSVDVFPVDTDILSKTNGSFEWLTPQGLDGIVQMTPQTSDIAAILTFFGDSTPMGWFIMVEDISGASAPYDFYPFKIIAWDGSVFHLENIHNGYPGNLMGATPNGSYNYSLVKGLFSGIVQYKGLEGDYYKFEVKEFAQTFEPNQWKGFWMHLDFTDAYGSRSYVRINHNSSNIFYCENPENSTLPAVNDYCHVCLDRIKMKTEPTEISASPAQPVEFGKFGNDWYSTKITREENANHPQTGFLLGNDRGVSFNLIEDKE